MIARSRPVSFFLIYSYQKHLFLCMHLLLKLRIKDFGARMNFLIFSCKTNWVSVDVVHFFKSPFVKVWSWFTGKVDNGCDPTIDVIRHAGGSSGAEDQQHFQP